MEINVTSEQVKLLAKAIREPMWDWHIYLGYGLSVLLLCRLALFFTVSGKQNFINLASLGFHKKLVSIGYIGIYSILIFMSISGLGLVYYPDLGLSKETVHDIKEVHEFMFNFIWVFVIVHLLGLVIAENKDEKGVVSRMI